MSVVPGVGGGVRRCDRVAAGAGDRGHGLKYPGGLLPCISPGVMCWLLNRVVGRWATLSLRWQAGCPAREVLPPSLLYHIVS